MSVRKPHDLNTSLRPPLARIAARTTFRHGNLRQAALNAVYTSMSSDTGDTPDKLSLRGIAEQLGVNHRALYRHFTDKDDLLRAAAVEGFIQLTEAVRASIATALSPRAAFAAYIDFAMTNPRLYRFMFERFKFGPPLKAARHDEKLGPALKRLLELTSEAYGAPPGTMAPPNVRDNIILAWGSVHGLINLYQSGGFPAHDDEAAKTYILKLLFDKSATP